MVLGLLCIHVDLMVSVEVTTVFLMCSVYDCHFC